MEYNQYHTLKKSQAIRMGINNSIALKLIDHLPMRYRAAHTFWSWVWLLSIPGAFVLGYLYSWWITPGVLFIITPAISRAVKKSCSEFILEYAEENQEFFDRLKEANILLFVDQDGNPFSS